MGSITAISAIALLRVFMKLEEGKSLDRDVLLWMTAIHAVLVLSALVMAISDRVATRPRHQSHPRADCLLQVGHRPTRPIRSFEDDGRSTDLCLAGRPDRCAHPPHGIHRRPSTMKSVRFVEIGKPAQVVDIPQPTPGPGQVLVKIGGAGVCHSDLHIMDEDLGLKGPFTLGHENAGWIAGIGVGLEGWKEGDAAAVYGPWGCGRCHTCQISAENYCENHAALGTMGGGLGSDGGMAEDIVLPSPRLLVPLGKLHPSLAAPLNDAALTPYHAIKTALPMLTHGTHVLVVSAVWATWQCSFCRHCAPLQSSPATSTRASWRMRVNLAFVIPSTLVMQMRRSRPSGNLTGPREAVLVLDFVGAQPSINLAARGGGPQQPHHRSRSGRRHGSLQCQPAALRLPGDYSVLGAHAQS